jgi:pimeloyl-ACP methyl ester carboxylesterase
MFHASKWRSALCAALAAGLGSGCATSPPEAAFDPIAMDPPEDLEFPARLAEGVFFESGGARMNAVLYEAAGAGPNPTVLVLHGFPGNERNLDLAHALRRAGWNSVFFHYRGTWGSGGSFSFSHVLEDVAAVLATLRDEEFAQEHRIDRRRIALVGHSMGGFAALSVAAERAEVACVASLAGANLGVLARAAQDPAQAALIGAGLAASGGGPIRDLSGEQLVAELRAHEQAFDLVAKAPALARKPVLLVAGSRDGVARREVHHTPLADAIAAQPGARLRSVVLDADHAFSGSRIAVARSVQAFLERDCAPIPD